ncbi:hypothetical protein COK37_21155 [Bacillus thuringiensis]|uniref:hypothetical protein n=1 Tax=Bacillus thuringiensis TaxID=1428 RepID=UPI000BF3F255|nr:hypothetical protein [Bacillus thuringiensis]PEV50731.1 hypothetical protein CN432_08955 [Bacillus thuringiensis]PFR65853.1 hypothetical protein COK37_21155 [Bacillus thuringiensis]PFT77452.1 hypothetical protein COK70_19930 [Bacillus thuringiensis]PFV87903.1 hypothetical protein COL06_14995 [Bacillus thuringiensis]
MTQSKNIKIGARILTEKQATILLPNFSKINNQINQFRGEAKKFNKILANKRGDNYQEYEIYTNFDNVVSILGERGSGKTSVFLTLKDTHSLKYANEDIILPLIVPDNMGETSDALGWIISYLEKDVLNLHPKLKIKERQKVAYNGFNKCIEDEDSELKINFKKLRKTYEIRKEVYLNKILKRDEGTKEYINDKARMIQADRSLIENFNIFVNSLINAKKEVNFDKEIEPLIIIFFDDVDISAHRCPEVLETIRNYLNHPNIVVFVSGDYKVFSEIMCLEFLRKEGVKSTDYNKVFIPTQQLQEQEINFFSALELRKERSQEYLKKVLPPSFRYYMKKLNERDKGNFSYEIVEGSMGNEITLAELLSRIENKGQRLFWGDNDIVLLGNKTEIPYAFFKMFDDNPRGLINPYYYLYQKIYLSTEQTWDISDINQFLHIMINSSSKLQKFKKNIEDIIVINETDQSTNDVEAAVYINYDLLLDTFLKESMNSKEEDIMLEECTTLYILCIFFEKLIYIVASNYNGFSSESILSRILNHKTKNLFPNIDQNHLILQIYSVLNNKGLLNRKKIFHEGDKGSKELEKKYFETLSKDIIFKRNVDKENDKDIESINLIYLFEKVFHKDEGWVNDKIKFIKNNGKSYQDIYYEVNNSIIDNFSFLDDIQRSRLIQENAHFTTHLRSEEDLTDELYEHFDWFRNKYDVSEDMQQINMKKFIKVGLNVEKLMAQRESLNAELNDLEKHLNSVMNQMEVTKEELENIGNKGGLIETREKMVDRIESLETFTQNDLRKNEWNLFKNNFVIGREVSEGKWLDENGVEIDKKPVVVFNPKDTSLEYDKLIQDNFESLTKVGLFVKEQNMISRTDIIKFIEKYFIEEQESLLLRANLPLDIEGRRKHLIDLHREVSYLEFKIDEFQSEIDGVEESLKYIYSSNDLGNDFEVEEPSYIYYILQERFKNYVLNSIYQQVDVLLENSNTKKIEIDVLLEILKIYEDSIEEVKNYLIDDKQIDDLELFFAEDNLYVNIKESEKEFLLNLSKRNTSELFKQQLRPLEKKGVKELHIDSIKILSKELKKVLEIRPSYFSKMDRENIHILIRNFESYINKPTNSSENEIEMIIRPVLYDIIRPYTYVKILVENKRIDQETSTVYFRKLKSELANYIHKKRNNMQQTRFVRFLEKILFDE